MRTRLLAACLTLSLVACGGVEPEPRGGAGARDSVLTSAQDIQVALAALPGAEVLGTHGDGVPFMIRGPLGMAEGSPRAATALEAHARVGTALARVAPAFRLRASDLVAQSFTRDEQGHTHLRYAQTRNGLRVVGHELVIHVDADGRVYAANGSARDGENVPAPSQARVSSEAAVAAALAGTWGGSGTQGAPRLVYVRSGEGQPLALAFEVVVTGELSDRPVKDHVFINALDGTLVTRFSDIHEAKNRKIYWGRALVRSEGIGPTGDVVVDKTYDNLGIFYDCFYTLFARDSYDGAGAVLKATVHASSSYMNAYWDGAGMQCGDGDGVTADAPCKDPDVVVHELTHAVTSYTSNLTYSGQSGGLNESLSDVFAAVCESWTRGFVLPDADVWKIGEDMWTPPTPGDALRYMNDPKADGASLDYFADYTSSVDVHYSSGISNLAFYLLAQGGVHPRGRSSVSVVGIGVEKAGRIFYKANRDLMTASTTFAQAKTYTEQAASMLGYSANVGSVTTAWQAVGVGLPPATALTNGVTLTGLSGSMSSQTHYSLDVPASKAVTFTMNGGAGDADMYVRFGAPASTSLYDCSPQLGGNNEMCNMTAKPIAGRYYVMLYGYSAYSGITLKGQYTP